MSVFPPFQSLWDLVILLTSVFGGSEVMWLWRLCLQKEKASAWLSVSGPSPKKLASMP